MAIKTKICGLKNKQAVEAAVSSGADYIGCVFFDKSPRNISPEDAGFITQDINSKKVAVLVDADDTAIQRIIDGFSPDYLQLHGDESVERTGEIKNKFSKSVIKAIKIRSSDDVAEAAKYEKIADMLLFDALPWDNMPSSLPGGNGIPFDWQLLRDRKFSIPWMLSGGLNDSNIEEAVKITGANIVDVSSSLEIVPGEKDIELINKFLQVVKEIK